MMKMTRIMMKNEEDKKRKLKRSSEKQTNPPLNMIINQTTLVWSRLKVCRLKPPLPPPSKTPIQGPWEYTWKYQPVWKNTLHAGFWASSANSTAGSDVKICKSLFCGSCTFTVEILWQLLIDVWRRVAKIQVVQELLGGQFYSVHWLQENIFFFVNHWDSNNFNSAQRSQAVLTLQYKLLAAQQKLTQFGFILTQLHHGQLIPAYAINENQSINQNQSMSITSLISIGIGQSMINR